MDKALPVYCKNCKNWFQSGIVFGPKADNVTLTFKGNIIQCPTCRRPCQIPDGTYRYVDQLITAVQVAGLSGRDLDKLSTLLRNAMDGTMSRSDLGALIDREFPKSNIGKFISDGWNLPFFLGLAVAALMWYFPKDANVPTTQDLKVIEKPANHDSRRRQRRTRHGAKSPAKHRH